MPEPSVMIYQPLFLLFQKCFLFHQTNHTESTDFLHWALLPISMYVFGLWEETAVPIENSHKYDEDIQIPHTKKANKKTSKPSRSNKSEMGHTCLQCERSL